MEEQERRAFGVWSERNESLRVGKFSHLGGGKAKGKEQVTEEKRHL